MAILDWRFCIPLAQQLSDFLAGAGEAFAELTERGFQKGDCCTGRYLVQERIPEQILEQPDYFQWFVYQADDLRPLKDMPPEKPTPQSW